MVCSLSSAHGSPAADPDIVYKVAESRLERAAAFRLVYQAYTRSRLIDPNPFQMRVTPYHLLTTTQTFIALLGGEVISTVSLMIDGQLGLPLEAIYGPEVNRLRGLGGRLGEVSALADRRKRLSRTMPVFVKLMRLMVQFARRQGVEQLLVAVHPRHARFYQQVLHFEALGEQKSYPLVRNNPAVALCLDFARLDRRRPANYETFFGTPLGADVLACSPITDAECAYFGPMAAVSGGFAVASGTGNEDGLRLKVEG